MITKKLNWQILTKNLVSFKRWDGVKDEKFQYYWPSLKNLIFKGGSQNFGVFEGSWYPNAHYDDKSVLWIFIKMPSEIFCSKICWQNSAKASFMYQQWTATVLIFLKVLTTDSLVLFQEYISRAATLMQASVITCK